ncbi:MAG: hypothetical protein IVW54_01090 [Candidatus Binataceae bacterium]|nr:hypothetical protein [Candidatus Binataceae bacterium]
MKTTNSAPRNAGQAINLILGLIIALAIPVWGLATLAIGLEQASGWWIVTGITIAIMGAVLFVGNPVIRLLFGNA